jgi:rhomboid protease GluP
MAGSFGKRGQQQWKPAPASARVPAAASYDYEPVRTAPRPAAAADSLPTIRFPFVSIFLLGLMAGIYALEVRYSPGGFVTARSVAAFGALEGDLVLRAFEWWRLFTAPLLHGSWGHLIGNAVVFSVVGFSLEPLIGPRWFGGLFALGALGGTLTSLFVNPAEIPSVGASGAIMGVLGAAFICGASARSGPKGRKMQSRALFFILPALIPFSGDGHTDFSAHLGGLLTGIAMGAVLLAGWTRGEDRPAFGEAGAGIGGIFLAIALASFLFFAGKPGNAAVAADAVSGLIPDTEMPEGLTVSSERARALLDKYPHDPRAHLFRGFAFLNDDHDLADAESQFREALDEKDVAAAHLGDTYIKTVTVLLAITFSYEGKPDLAQSYGTPLCGFAEENLGNIHDTMRERGICP